MLIDVNTLVKKSVEHKQNYVKNIKNKIVLKFSNIILLENKIHTSNNNINIRHKNSLKKS